MHRTVFVLLLLTAFARQTTFAQLLQQENLTYYNLNGKVKSFTETLIPKTTSANASAVKSKQTVSFNPERNISKLERYNDAGLTYVRNYTYTPLSYTYVVKLKQKVKGQDVWVTATPRIYTYNDKTRKEETKGGGEPTHIGYYNEMGETDSIYVYSLSRKLIQKIRHLYNAGGNIIVTKIFKPDDILMQYYIFKWDKYGRKIAEQCFKAPNQLKYTRNYQYDRFNNETELQESVSADDQSKGKLVVGKKTFVYRYDSYHNWINRDELNNAGKLISSTERKISYY